MSGRRIVAAAAGTTIAVAIGIGIVTALQPVDPTPPTPGPSTTIIPIPDAPPTDRPNDAVTPGDTITGRATDVCTPGWATAHRQRLTLTQKTAVLKAYELPLDTKISEWDHLIPLELGGGNGTKNIWPMTNRAQDQRKDRLENRLHDDVCDRGLPLVDAQARARDYWRWW